VARRTPGFSGWQQEHWLYHCGDAAAFFGPAGWDEIAEHPDVAEALGRELSGDGWSEHEVAAQLRSLRGTESPSAYLFRCLVCGVHLAYMDID
jgi:uncharacterized protein